MENVDISQMNLEMLKWLSDNKKKIVMMMPDGEKIQVFVTDLDGEDINSKEE